MKNRWVLLGMFLAVQVGFAEEIELVNGDFEETTQNAFASGFDDNAGYDTPGWEDYGTYSDSGVEDSGAWWGTYEGYAAFMTAGEGAILPTSYAIRPGDKFTVGFAGKTWDASSQWTVTLYYGEDPANALGTYVADLTSEWVLFTTDEIAGTSASVGQPLGLLFQNTGSGFANLDNVTAEVSHFAKPAMYIVK